MDSSATGVETRHALLYLALFVAVAVAAFLTVVYPAYRPCASRTVSMACSPTTCSQ